MYLNIHFLNWVLTALVWLTLTWDVFKFLSSELEKFFWIWLTLTWDVFKYDDETQSASDQTGLTLTWDVFKFIYFTKTIIKTRTINFNMRCI